MLWDKGIGLLHHYMSYEDKGIAYSTITCVVDKGIGLHMYYEDKGIGKYNTT